jgi:hypothetical protein
MIHLAHRNPSLLKLRQTFSSSSSFTPSCISSLNNKKRSSRLHLLLLLLLTILSPLTPKIKNKIQIRFTEILRQPDTQISQFRNCVNDERQEEEDNNRIKNPFCMLLFPTGSIAILVLQ